MRYFLDIIGILVFCDFMIFPSRHNTLILQSCFLCFQEWWKYSLSSVDIGIIGQTVLKPFMQLYVDFFIFVFLNSYSPASKFSQFIT